LNNLVKALEEEFGVSAAAMVVSGWVWAGWAAEEEDAASNIELTAIGGQKIAVIKAIKSLLGLGLKEAKEKVESAPVILKENVTDDEIEAFKAQLEEAWATVSLK
jgi:large subunit ribosomal protein L7/L12